MAKRLTHYSCEYFRLYDRRKCQRIATGLYITYLNRITRTCEGCSGSFKRNTEFPIKTEINNLKGFRKSHTP